MGKEKGVNIKDGAVDNWGGHWQKDAPLNPDFSKIGGKPPKEVKRDDTARSD